MSLVEKFYPESRYGGFTDIDGTIAFYMRVNSLLSRDSVIADVGCGRGEYASDPVPLRRSLRMFRGKVHSSIGLDIDPSAASNPFIDEFRHISDVGAWPLADSSVNMVIADCVIEHLTEPLTFFSEAYRVLRPGGYLCIRTCNKWSYVGIAARFIPNRLHASIVCALQPDRSPSDVFPTFYRCNTCYAIRRHARLAGFVNPVVYGYEAEPSYLSFSRIAYACGVIHNWFAPSILKPTLFAFATR